MNDVMITGLPTLVPQMSLEHAFSKIKEANVSALPVVDNAGQLIGLFTTENVSELIMVQSALAKKIATVPWVERTACLPNVVVDL